MSTTSTKENKWRQWMQFIGWGTEETPRWKWGTRFYSAAIQLILVLCPTYEFIKVRDYSCSIFRITPLVQYYCGKYQLLPKLTANDFVSLVSTNKIYLLVGTLSSIHILLENRGFVYNIYVIYSLAIVVTYTTFFLTMFCERKKEITEFICNVEDRDNEDPIPINEMLIKLSRYKYKLQNTINVFAYMFSLVTVTGAIGCLMFYRSYSDATKYDLFITSDFVFWFIIQTTFYYTSGQIATFKKKITYVIGYPEYIHVNLYRPDRDPTTLVLRASELQDDANQLETTIDWLAVNTILNENWCELTVLGISIHSPENLERILTVFTVILLFFISNSSTQEQV